MKKEIFINNFERLRKQAGLSRKKVFEDLGLCQSLFTNWKKQNKLPNVETVFKISKYFNVSMENLLIEEDLSIGNFNSYRQTIIKEIIENLEKLK